MSVAQRDTTPQRVRSVRSSHSSFVSVHLVYVTYILLHLATMLLTLTVLRSFIQLSSLKKKTNKFDVVNSCCSSKAERIPPGRGSVLLCRRSNRNACLPQQVTGIMLSVLDGLVIP